VNFAPTIRDCNHLLEIFILFIYFIRLTSLCVVV
jgi:hypothetical protein